ncbi:hypothetical protein FKW77_005691 [Venturia effusa]|uniref:PH domain-containing protein n=1 Tax=Venturia effusa TaxID=50376 RepID=A0A517LNZ5_9PEZI|nr:hypothetical protein FKW77_005691 [Venturia effusa]
MAETLSPMSLQAAHLQQSQPSTVPVDPMKIQSGPHEQRGLFLDGFSPVNQNGSFEFDRVLKSGQVHKRTRKTKSWKPVSLVLRQNILSIYKDHDCTKLRHQINLSDLTAVARQRDPKGKAKHVFGLFSPERNYHIEAPNDKEAQAWVDLIRHEARIDRDDEENMVLMSPTVGKSPSTRFFRRSAPQSSSGSEPEALNVQKRTRNNQSANPVIMHSAAPMHSAARAPSHGLQSYSGNEQGSYSDFSDTGFFPPASGSTLSLPAQERALQEKERNAKADAIYQPSAPSQARPSPKRNTSTLSANHTANERVVNHGRLLLLKSHRGVRQWKSVWAVLRPKSLALYKNEEEYSALLVLDMHGVLDAVDIDPQSRTKVHCLQVITEERNYRFCASSEEDLAKWVGAFKSLLKKRRESEREREQARAAGKENQVSPEVVVGR